MEIKQEKIEWFNYWIEDADMQEKNRILLIGDSVTRQYRGILNSILSVEGYVCDLVATSRCIMDETFENELKNFCENMINKYSYKYTVFHLGAHHGYWFWCKDSLNIRQIYKEKLEVFMDIISKVSENIIVASGTFENLNIGDKKIIENNNYEIQTRNYILNEISKEKGYRFIDLYSIMETSGYKQTDRFHFERVADEFMANRVAEAILNIPKKEIINQVGCLKDFNDNLRKYSSIYIYGNGKRGKYLKQYLELFKIDMCGFIVSESYFTGEEGTISFEKFMQNNPDYLVIVTPQEYGLFCELYKQNINYVSVTKNTMLVIENIVDAFNDFNY